jgi:hypothetical protein
MNAETIRFKKQPFASLVILTAPKGPNERTYRGWISKSDQAHLEHKAVASNHKVGLPTQGRIARTFPDKDVPVKCLLAASGLEKQPEVEITPLGLKVEEGEPNGSYLLRRGAVAIIDRKVSGYEHPEMTRRGNNGSDGSIPTTAT